MAEVQYLDIILNGLIFHKDTYSEYLRRKLKEAETQNFVSENEFLKNCNEVIKHFYNEFNKQYLLRKSELNKIITYSKANEESYNDVSEDLKQLNINQFVIHLHSFTNGKFNGDLYFDDFVFIHSELEKITNKYSNVLDIFKEPLKEINFQLNNYFENLEPLEIKDFLIWLEFDVLNKWQISKKLNSQQTNIVGSKFLSFHSEKFNQKIDYLENWINEKKINTPINLKSVKIQFNNNLGFTKFKNDYALLLENYLIEDEDNTEKTFIKQQLFSFNEYLSFMVNGTMTKAKKQMLLEDLEKPTTIEKLKQVTEQKIEFLEDKLKEVSNYSIPQPIELITEKKEVENNYLGQPTNQKANDFFDFLIEHYRQNEKTSVKFVNILHFLKNDANKSLFIFKLKQADYKILVQSKTGILIKKFAKSERYIEDEKPILYTLETTFLKNYKV